MRIEDIGIELSWPSVLSRPLTALLTYPVCCRRSTQLDGRVKSDQQLAEISDGGPGTVQHLNSPPPVSDAVPPFAAAQLDMNGARANTNRSPVWFYYERLSKNSASCRFCQRVIRGAPTCSSNFWGHLKRLHAADVERLGGEHAALVASWREASRRRSQAGAAAAMAAEARQVPSTLQGAPQRSGTVEEAQGWMKPEESDVSEPAWVSPRLSGQEAPPAFSQHPV